MGADPGDRGRGMGSGHGVWGPGLGCRVCAWGLGCGVGGVRSGCRVWAQGLGVGLGVGSGRGVWVQGLGAGSGMPGQAALLWGLLQAPATSSIRQTGSHRRPGDSD